VFDTYGFAPRAAYDGAALQAAADEGASDAELEDLMEEMSMTRAATAPVERAELAEALSCGGVTCTFQNAGEEGNDPLRLIKRLARFTYLTDMARDLLVRATRPDDIVAAKEAGKHCLYLTGNGVPLAQRFESAEGELAYVRIFFQLGIRMMHLTYNRRNALGDGCAELANGGISDLGREAIGEMNRVGVIVDVAHSGWQTSLEAAQASKRPMVASHTTCAGLNKHIRAKPDDALRAIVDTGGLAGICCIPNFLGGTADIAALIDHVDYVAKRFGVEHVGIGTDVAHRSQYASLPEAKGPSRATSRTRYEALWPPGSRGGRFPRAATLAWTNWPLFTVGLVQRGYRDDDIQKIIGGNMLRVCREALAEE
jgi:membrane dipeptidase